MAKISILYHGCMLLLVFGCRVQGVVEMFDDGRIEYMSREERDSLKQEAKEMFYHAYNAYMDNAYPADELMPLSCKGRYRGSEQDRGDIDSVLGNFSLTLVDTLDTLVVINDLAEFEKAVKLVIKGVTFNTDVIVSLFETNIRILGGLLSGHILADYIKQRENVMPWYKGELLGLAKDLGYRFLPAFNTTTGIPFGRINLKYGMKGVPSEMMRETCTACAGSMILEMAALSRLTGELIFEEKAQKAMDVLWRLRHRGTDLMGSVLNVNSGDWVRRDAGVGAGIDSYYEYCLKAYILLGDEKYLGRFNKHYSAIMKYISQGPMLLDVHMHRPTTNSKNFMDALLAFWPGLQVLKGDIKPAVETHEMLYQVMQRHNFIPEAFTTDFQVHWGHHPLRPEFLESTYFLYKATGDHYYLGVGRKVLKSLQTYARVTCGFAAVSDVRTNKHDDTMDSFVLSETFKYLYLLFAEPSDLILNLDEYVFTTEGHLLPLSLASVRFNTTMDIEREKVHVEETDRTCPNSVHLFPASVRQPLRNMVEDVCPKRLIKKRLSASQFTPSNIEHLKLLSDMGITVLSHSSGGIQLLHTLSNAKSSQDAEDGLLFMQEIVELGQSSSHQQETRPVLLAFDEPNTKQKITLLAGPAAFGVDLRNEKITGRLTVASPSLGCEELKNPEMYKGTIVIVNRGSCLFIDKARILQRAGALGGIVFDNTPSSSARSIPMFAMSGDGKQVDDVTIPFVFLFSEEASQLRQAFVSSYGNLHVTMGGVLPKDEAQLKAPTDPSMFERLKGTLREILSKELASQKSPSTVQHSQADTSVQSSENPLTYAYLRADVDKTAERLVRISINLKSTFNMNIAFNAARFDSTNWSLLRKLLINELFGTLVRNNGIVIHPKGIEKAYSLIMIDRGVNEETISKANMSDKIVWFLKELSEVRPDPNIIALYVTMHHNVNEQHLISYIFKDVAYNIRQLPNLESVVKSRGFSESFIMEVLIEKFEDVLNNAQSLEFEIFLKKHMPTIIQYIIDASLNVTLKDNSDIEILSIKDYINKDTDLSIVKYVFNSPKLATNKKKTAEISKTKKGVVRIELASEIETEDAGSSMWRNAQRGDIEVDDHVQSSSIKRVKRDKIEDVDVKEPIILSREKGENEDLTKNQEIEKSVPITPVKDSTSSSDKNNNKVQHAHDDL